MNAVLRCALLVSSGLMPTRVVHAEVRQSAADSFLVAFSEPVAATPDARRRMAEQSRERIVRALGYGD